jgi:hypothetical protein
MRLQGMKSNFRFLKCTASCIIKMKLAHEGPEGKRYSSTLSLTSAPDKGGCLTPCPGHFTPRKENWYQLRRRLGGPHGQYGRVPKISPPTRIRPPDGPARSEPLYRLRYPGRVKLYYAPQNLHTTTCT